MTEKKIEPPLDSELENAIDSCKAVGIDPYPMMAAELRKLGYTVVPPNVGGMGRAYEP
jgi:predicted nuclease with RNAse H fold